MSDDDFADDAPFDPMAEEYESDGDNEEPDLDEAGTYLLAFVYFHEMRTSKNGNPYARIKARVLYGHGGKSNDDKSGHVLWESVFVNARAFKRLSAYCKAMGYLEKFNPRDDDQLRRALLGRPFVAKVKIEPGSNGYPPKARVKWPQAIDWPEEVADAAAAFQQSWDADAAAGGSSSGGGSGFDNEAPMPDADDNIPF